MAGSGRVLHLVAPDKQLQGSLGCRTRTGLCQKAPICGDNGADSSFIGRACAEKQAPQAQTVLFFLHPHHLAATKTHQLAYEPAALPVYPHAHQQGHTDKSRSQHKRITPGKALGKRG